jgi:DNA-binding MltR family transcriptional regulator
VAMNLDTFRLVEAEAELRGTSDRAAAIVGASLIELQLEQLLIQSMVKGIEPKPLFEGFGPLSSFSAKIRIAEFFGLLPPDICADADLIRKIRNEFAHTHEQLSFEAQKITSWLAALRALAAIRQQLSEYKQDPEKWAQIEAKGWHRARFLFFVAISSTQGTIAVLANSRPQRDPIAPAYAELKRGT